MDTIDKKVMELFDIVKAQKESFEKAERESKQSWKTKCSISFGATPINIQTSSLEGIKQIVKSLLIEQDYSKKTSELLGLVEDDNLFQGFSFEDWFADCKKRITVIDLRAKKDNLTKMEERLNKVISPEQKRQLELESITRSLGL